MKKKFLGRVLTMLLVASMVFTLLPAPAIAAGNWWWNNEEYTEEAVPTATTDDYNRILHLDCGRKYFTKDWIIALLHEMKAAGYNQLELAFGNDGLRFLLDKMSFTANGTTYDYNTIVQKVEAGNEKQNSSGDKRWLTQAEMDKIIETANGLDIEIVPLLNLPGHANAILDIADDTLNAFGSNNTLDVANSAEAREFGKAIFAKYLDYFCGKGCKFFNFGADEYANDASGTFSFSRLNSTQYQAFVSFINDLAGMIIKKGMTPRAFNDGLYYNRGEWDMNTSVNTNIPKIQCCYWSPGWDSYPVASADTIAQKGHGMINTHGDWYYVTKYDNYGNEVIQIPSDSAIEGFSNTSFAGGKINNPVGSMFCIWCDAPAIRTEQEIAGNIRLLLRKMAARMQDKSIETISTDVVPGGFNEDGSLTTTTPTPPDGGTTTPETITITVGDSFKETINGHVYDADVKTEGSSAEWALERKSEPTTTETPVSKDNLGGSFYIKNADGQYLSAQPEWTSDSSEAAEWTCVGNGNTDTYYVKLNAGGKAQWVSLYGTSPSLTSDTYWRSAFSFNETTGQLVVYYGAYEMPLGTPVVKTEGETKDYTVVTFTGKSEGTTYVTIGNVKYTIIVTDKAPDNALTGDSITLEHWITNGKVAEQKTSENNTTTISKETTGVQTENGVEIKGYAFAPGYWNNSTEVTYWQAVRLDSAHKQTGDDGIDQTAVGTTLTHVRYQNGAWQYKTLDGNWQYFQSGDQLVAYYLQKIPVTEEITTYFKDYGYRYSELPQNTSSGKGQVALTVAVVYPDGSVSPAEGNMYSKSTTIFNYWNNRNIGIISAANNSEYTISKITVTDGTRVYSNSNYDIVWQNGDTVTWKKKLTDDGKTEWYNETVVWDEQTNAGSPVVNGSDPSCNAVCTWSVKNTAKLVLIYLKPVVKETNLHLAYYDDTHNEQIIDPIDIAMTSVGTVTPTFTTELKDANGNVIGGTVKWPGTTSSEEGYLPDDAYVVNSSGVHQPFNKNLPTVPGVAPNYKSGVYKYNGAVISDDGKTLTLHYVLNQDALKHTYVFDFGLPINIPVSDLVDNPQDVETIFVGNTDLSSANYTTAFGSLHYNSNEQTIVYTPTKTWTENDLKSVGFNVKYTDANKKTDPIIIGVLPASNVLYEENFLTQSNESGLGWTKVASDKSLGSQETQKVNGTGSYNVFGRDTAYDTVSGPLGVWKIENLKPGQSYPCLSTTFYGNGFDLIGNCSPTTGRVLLLITDLSGKGVKAAIVDTRYNSAGENGIYQVPLAHLELEEGTYIAEVRASGLTGSGATRSAVMQASSLNADIDEFASVLAECGLTMADVEFIEMSSGTAKPANRVPSYYAASVAEAATFAPGTHVEIDGFRVYRSTTDAVAMNYYPANEQNIDYQNIIKVMANKVITAYSDNGVIQNCEISEYQKQGGPKKEIYLKQGQSISFNVQGHDNLQVSLRAVTGSAQTNVVSEPIATNTEMYYTIGKTEGLFTISNTGEGILAIGNVKLPNGAKVQTADDLDEAAVFASVRAAFNTQPDAPDQGAFAPEVFNVGGKTTRMFRNKIVTLRVKVSADVDYVTIDNDVYRTNKWTARLFGYSTITVTKTVRSGDSHEYSVVAYNAQGQASAAKTWGY